MTFSSSVTHALHCWLSFTKRIHVKRKKKKWASKKYIWCSNLDRTKHVLTKLRFEKAFEHFVKVLNLLRFIQWIKVKTNNRVSHAITFHALQNRKICNVNHGVKNSVNCSPLEVKVHRYVCTRKITACRGVYLLNWRKKWRKLTVYYIDFRRRFTIRARHTLDHDMKHYSELTASIILHGIM